MKDLVIYQLEVASCLAVFHFFYQLLLKKETHFTMRRYYFLSAGILAFIIPAMHFSIDLAPDDTSLPSDYLQYLPQQFMEFTPIYSPVQSSLDVWTIVGYIWLIGFMIMCTRICLSLFQVHKVLRNSAHGENSNLFKISDSKTQSFSFFKNIVLSKNHDQSHAFNYILAHEQAHSDQYHSVDVLLMEMIKAMQWFNPFVWLLTKEALQNLEYLADESVIEKHPNSMEYQKAIVQFAQPSYVNHLRSEFSKSNLKDRIVMMNRPKAPKIHAWKMLLLLPIVGVMLMSFSLKVDTSGSDNDFTQFMQNISQNPMLETEAMGEEKIAKKRIITGSVLHAQNSEAIVGANVIIKETSRGTITDDEGHFRIEVNTSEDQLIVSMPGMRTQVVDISNIENVIVKLKSENPEYATYDKVTGLTLKRRPNQTSDIEYSYIGSNEKKPLFIINGKEDPDGLDSIDPKEIKSIDVIKDEAAEAIYGDNGKNGVVIIKAKGVDKAANTPIFVLDGKTITKQEFTDLDASTISKIEVKKDSTAIIKYGEKAKYGVVFIKTK